MNSNYPFYTFNIHPFLFFSKRWSLKFLYSSHQLLSSFLFVFLLACFQYKSVSAQTITQTIRGVVIDKNAQSTLPGATVVIDEQLQSVLTDDNGKFRLEKIPIGRHQVKVNFIGYKEVNMPVLLNSAKELVLTIELEEQFIEVKEVVISASSDKSKAQNEMATISSRTVSMEESNRYAGTRNDPARMVASFAGVSGGNDTRNDIVVRGNSPTGMLWRLEGVDIPNPNHFSVNGATSGPISILNNNTLANSDFLTSAFPAEYINALSGVFDLKMRNGNNEKREFVGQIGVNGVEIGAEGPFSQKKSSSYMFNFRYSNLVVMQKLGINYGSSSIPFYYDGSFKLNFPLKNGSISAFGLGGKSTSNLYAKNYKEGEELFGSRKYNFLYGGNMLASGVNITRFLNKKSYLRLTTAFSQEGTGARTDSLNSDLTKEFKFNEERYLKYRTSLNFTYNIKFNSRVTFKTGVLNDRYDFNFYERRYNTVSGAYKDLISSNGYTYLSRAFAEGIVKITPKLNFYPGISSIMLHLNNHIKIEPRASLVYEINPITKFSFGYGNHNRMQDLSLYFVESLTPAGNYVKTNKNLDFTGAHHLVAGYDWSFNEHARIKSEVYYQWIYRAPVEQKISSFSFLNAGSGFGIPMADSLVNNGKGRNYGMELTVERFFYKGWYALGTLSLYESFYSGSNGIEYNTAFNGNYVGNILAGKEFKLNDKNSISLDYKLVRAGGRRYTPINEYESKLKGRTVYYESFAYARRYSDYFRMDLKVAYKRNGAKTTQEIAISAENLTNHKNLFNEEFNPQNGKITKIYQLGLFIVGFYRINF